MIDQQRAIVIVARDAGFARYLVNTLQASPQPFDISHITTAAHFSRPSSLSPVIVLFDAGADPVQDWVDDVRELSAAEGVTSVVVVTAVDEPEVTRRALRAGADEVIVKTDIGGTDLAARLAAVSRRDPVPGRAAGHARLLLDAGAVQERVAEEALVEGILSLVVRDLTDVAVYLEPGAMASSRVAVAPEVDSGRPAAWHEARAEALRRQAQGALAAGDTVILSELPVEAAGTGAPVGWTSAVLVPVRTGADGAVGVLVAARSGSAPSSNDDIEALIDLGRRLALALENRRLRRQGRELFETDLTGNFVALADGTLTDCNPAFARMLGYEGPEAVRDYGAAALFGGEVSWREFVGAVARDGRLKQQEMALRARDNRPVHALVSASGVFGEHGRVSAVRGQVFDLSAHKHLEEQLSQSQKMEAVGRLAGGIAHDFNNLLMIIGGQANRLLDQLAPGDSERRGIEAIAGAADRAAGLTQQLLAFSRRQVLSPRVLCLNTVVRHVHGMLERVIGEDITCVVTLHDDIANVRADPGRLEQALLNLAVNARDAMPGGGTLSISTRNVEIDEAYGRQHFGAVPGRYVMVAVSDTGSGMDPETRTRAFEPFFTTKEVGKGTGLGLSMVYGIVKQSDGYIWVYSELGLGTTFKIYLPVVEAAAESLLPPASPSAPTGSETILLVEDEDGVRELLDELLTAQGYRVLSASRGAEALAISEAHDADIQLLVTDVVMPQMSGHELSLRLRARRPSLRVLYLSGYTDETIAHHGVIEPYAAFLGKPFTRAALANKVRDVLGASAP